MVEDTKQNIVDAAIFVFNEDLSAPLEKVSDKAGITRRTLHRYFKDRKELLVACHQDMQQSCGRAMNFAMQSSDQPLEQLKQWLYAAIDCGSKYAFLHKLLRTYGQEFLQGIDIKGLYDPFEKIKDIIRILKEDKTISQDMTYQWISSLFLGVVTACLNLVSEGAIDSRSLKELSWYSFSKGIGI